ncbi:MAG: peptidase [Parcubacteria group bacterium]|nr:peptidase [Parcubacteria group bacterium]
MDAVFQILILIMSVVIHEVSHGYAALFYGDHTAEYEGRLTLNPLKHLDPFGSVILPILLYFSSGGGFVFGWAKPVPYNPHNLRPGRWPEAFVALAGPLSNLTIALIFGLVIRFSGASAYSLNSGFYFILSLIVFINLTLAIFNLVPLPPLDGSKILFAIFPDRLYRMRGTFERYGVILTLIFIFFVWQFVAPVAGMLFQVLTGVSL